ncbi:MAG: LysR family transcriptional regulator [Trebonia sp.]
MAELRAFLVAADELHFGRAAERLRVSPSRVSQLVRCLETQVGAPLFERTTRRVELTQIGVHLYTDLTRVYDDLNTSMRRAKSAAKGLAGKVTVGYLTHCEDTAFTRLVAEFQACFPACDVGTTDVTGTDYYDVLRNGSVDVLLGRFGADPPPSGLVQGPVMSREDWVLGVARAHSLAPRDVVSVEELADEAIFGVPDKLTGELSNPLYPARTPKGRPIPCRGIARTFAEVLALVARRENVFPVGASFPAHYGHPEVAFVPLHGWPPATRTVVWRAHGNTALVTAFIDTASAERSPDLPPLGNPGYGDWPGPRAVDVSPLFLLRRVDALRAVSVVRVGSSLVRCGFSHHPWSRLPGDREPARIDGGQRSATQRP